MNKRLYEAMFKRKSVRKYSEEKLSEEKLSKIEGMIANVEPLMDNIDLQIHLVKNGEKI